MNNRLYAVKINLKYGKFLIVVRATSKKKADKLALNVFQNSTASIEETKLLKSKGKEEIVIIGGMEE
jgi:N-acetylglucosamine kinase-like BadF-type ATPase